MHLHQLNKLSWNATLQACRPLQTDALATQRHTSEARAAWVASAIGQLYIRRSSPQKWLAVCRLCMSSTAMLTLSSLV